MTNCFHCGDDDHMARECPRNRKQQNTVASATGGHGVPAVWCSYCDENTRLVDLGHSMQRCPNCHPLRFQQLKQSRKCALCNKTVFNWDNSPCEAHAGPSLPRPPAAERPASTRIAPEPPAVPSYRTCYRSLLGIMTHGPNCACPAGSA